MQPYNLLIRLYELFDMILSTVGENLVIIAKHSLPLFYRCQIIEKKAMTLEYD